jgi:hypothetical protein
LQIESFIGWTSGAESEADVIAPGADQIEPVTIRVAAHRGEVIVDLLHRGNRGQKSAVSSGDVARVDEHVFGAAGREVGAARLVGRVGP